MLTVTAGLAAFSGFAPMGTTPAHMMPAASSPALAASRVLMSAGGGTETMDIELGKIVNDRELLDADLLQQGRRARPGIDWSNLRARLEIEFKLSDEELKKYDDVSSEDLLKACAAAARSHPLAANATRVGSARRAACRSFSSVYPSCRVELARAAVCRTQVRDDAALPAIRERVQPGLHAGPHPRLHAP